MEGDKDSLPQRGENTGLEVTSAKLNEPYRPMLVGQKLPSDKVSVQNQ